MHIDWWTLTFQTVNVLVLVWILGRFLFRPVTDIVVKRQEMAGKLLADAAAANRQAADRCAEAERTRLAIDGERERLLAEARQFAQTTRGQLLVQTSQEIAKLRDEAKTAILRDQEAAQEKIGNRASELAVEIAQRLLARFPPQIALSAFLDGLCQELKSPDTRDGFISAAAGDPPTEIVTAGSLSEDEIQAVQGALNQALGLTLSWTFRSDPTLLAGIELHGRNKVLRNSWRADLTRIREELDRDKSYAQS